MGDVALVIPRPEGEYRISLHPISLALVLAETITEATLHRCRRRGHQPEADGRNCIRCGTALPDTDAKPSRAWRPALYRSFVGNGDIR